MSETAVQPVDHGGAGHHSKAGAVVKGAATGLVAGPEGAAAGAIGGALSDTGDDVRTYSASNKALVAEFVVCMAVLILTPLVNKGADVTVSKFMKKASATAGVFVVLGFVSAIGDTPRKAAQGIGFLVTLTVLINERSVFGQLVQAVGGKAPADTPPSALTDSVQGGVRSATDSVHSTFESAIARARQVSR